MTKAQLIIDLKNMIGPAGKGSEVSDTGLTSWLNEAYMVAVATILEFNPDYFTKNVTASSVISQGEYTLPDDFEKIVLASVSYDGTTWTRALPLNNIGQASAVTQTNNTDFDQSQPFYYLTGNEIGFLPVFGATLSNNIKTWYSYTPSEMEDDEDEPEIPVRMQYQLKYMAYANYLDQNDEHVAAERMRQRFETNIERMAIQLSERQVDQPRSVEVESGDDLYVSQYI